MNVLNEQSRFIVYVDEAGGHGPGSPEFPVFVLAFCIFEKQNYADKTVPAFTKLKFDSWGHDAWVLHEREIRKQQGHFAFLRNAEMREWYMAALNELVISAEFTLVAAVIDKTKLHKKYAEPRDSYHLAVEFGLERIGFHLAALEDKGTVNVIFESRGTKEDADLELAFHRAVATHTKSAQVFVPLFAKKSANHVGLQIADLVARPTGIHVIHPMKPNRAYDIIQTKFRRDTKGNVDGWGLKCFPSN
jgi:hypothetical protein